MTSKQKQPEPQTEQKRFPFIMTVFGGFNLVVEKMPKFLLIASLFSLISMAVYFAGGQESLCFNEGYRLTHWCAWNASAFLSVRLIVFALVLLFIKAWVVIALKGEKLSLKTLFVPTKSVLKLLGLLLAWSMTFVVAGISFYLLLVRIPNPDWRIEMAYFTVVSLGFFVPLFGLRFLSWFGFAAAGEPLPSVKEMWKRTSGSMLPIIAFFGFFMFVLMFGLQMSVRFTFVSEAGIMQAILAEYLTMMIIFLVIACFMNYCYIQRGFIKQGETA